MGVFVGHFAVGFAAKRLTPKTSLGWLVLAPLFADVLWPILVLGGIERVRIVPGDTAVTPLAFDHYPWSHSLALLGFWGALLGGLHFVRTSDRRAAWILFAGVVSHWVLDFVAHRPDMPLALGIQTKVGLGMWRSLPLTMAVELAMFAASLWLYVQTTRPTSAGGRWGFVAFVAVVLVSYFAALLGPPPPSVPALAATALVGILFVPWAHAFDRRRALVDAEPTAGART